MGSELLLQVFGAGVTSLHFRGQAVSGDKSPNYVRHVFSRDHWLSAVSAFAGNYLSPFTFALLMNVFWKSTKEETV